MILHFFHRNIKQYHDKIDKFCNKFPFKELYEPNFFEYSNLSQIPKYSPRMLTIFCTLASIDVLMKDGKRKDSLLPIIEDIAMYLIQTTTVNGDTDYLFYVADAVSRAAWFPLSQSRFTKSKTFSLFSYDLLEIIAAREPSIRLFPLYEKTMRSLISVYPDIGIIKQAYEWAFPLNRPRLIARIITTLIFRTIFTSVEQGQQAVPSSPNPPLNPSQLQILLPLVDQLEIALYNGKYHLMDDSLVPLSASTANIVETTLRALRSYFKWDLESSLMAIEECAIQAPIIFDMRPDSNIVLDVAAFVSVQLFGLAISEYNNTFFNLSPRDIKRLANWTELLLKYSRLCPWPWGKYINEWNEGIFKNFLKKSPI